MSPGEVLLAAGAEVAAVAEGARARGSRVLTPRQLPVDPWDLEALDVTCIAEASDVEGALVAALRGCRVVLEVGPDPDASVLVAADLARLGALRGERRGPAVELPLSAEQREVLRTLAEGGTIAEAAASLHLSHRTVERRVAAARRALGVRSTTEAVGLLLETETADVAGSPEVGHGVPRHGGARPRTRGHRT